MTATQPEVVATGRYSTKDTARLLGVSIRTIQHWIKENKLKVQIRKINGQTFITGTEILKAWNQTY